jgi:hypothetical protein
MDFGREVEEIGNLMMSAALIQEIRREVATVMRDGFIVSDGIHHPLGGGYDVVVRCGSEDRLDVFRRIRGKIQDVQVEKIADGVLGIKSARRMRGRL